MGDATDADGDRAKGMKNDAGDSRSAVHHIKLKALLDVVIELDHDSLPVTLGVTSNRQYVNATVPPSPHKHHIQVPPRFQRQGTLLLEGT